MSLGGGGPSGPSQQEISAQAERTRQLQEQREKAEREADRARRDRISKQRTLRGGGLGRRSLISGSELGEDEKLG